MNDFVPFSERHGLTPPDAPISIRAEAPDWLRRQFLWIACEVGLKPSKLREIICAVLIEAPNPMNWGDGLETEEEVRALLDGAEWYQQELHEALGGLSRRPEPDLTGALHHAMAALECVARDLTGEPSLTLGDWWKRHPTAFPQPLGSALGKLWGYTSQYGRHVEEGKPENYDEAELVVSLAGALSVYLLRRASTRSDGTLLNVRSAWYVYPGSDAPRFVTAHPLPKR